jgi:hypothetical protein
VTHAARPRSLGSRQHGSARRECRCLSVMRMRRVFDTLAVAQEFSFGSTRRRRRSRSSPALSATERQPGRHAGGQLRLDQSTRKLSPGRSVELPDRAAALPAGVRIAKRSVSVGKSRLALTSYGERLFSIYSGEVMYNLIHNHRVVVGVAVAVLLAVAIVLVVLYSGGGHTGY